jgi:hypothetical protein
VKQVKIKQDEMGRACSMYVSGGKCVQIVGERKRPFGRPRHRKKDGTEPDVKSVRFCTGFICLRIGTSGELLSTRLWSFGFHKGGKFLTS